ncbi:hypothetical protein OG21DRAFT_1489401 [Imleria badia]|nr:hypothetical protein OG21DRAFT_1489401 [Imleria badia]
MKGQKRQADAARGSPRPDKACQARWRGTATVDRQPSQRPAKVLDLSSATSRLPASCSTLVSSRASSLSEPTSTASATCTHALTAVFEFPPPLSLPFDVPKSACAAHDRHGFAFNGKNRRRCGTRRAVPTSPPFPPFPPQRARSPLCSPQEAECHAGP